MSGAGDDTSATTRSMMAEVRTSDALVSNTNQSSIPPICNPLDAVRHFIKSGRLDFHGIPKSGRKKRKAEAFNGDTFTRLACQHYEKHKIPEKFRGLAEKASKIVHGGPTVVQINNVATFENVAFLICHQTNRLVSVRYPEQKLELLKRGFKEIHCNHFTGEDLTGLPAACELEVGAAGQLVSANGVPIEVTLPDMKKKGTLPAIHQEKNEKICSAIIRAFEEKVVVVESGRTRIFSPYYLWTEELRKSNGWVSGDTLWLKRCKTYWVCKIMLRGDYPGLDPTPESASDIKESMKQLEKRATERRSRLEVEGAIQHESSWFDLALQAYHYNSGRQ